MKNLSYFAIPVFVVIVVFAGAFVWKMIVPSNTTTTDQNGALPNSLTSATGDKPSNPFSLLFGGKETETPIPTPTPASAAAMNADLQVLIDDGGVAEFTSLQKEVNGL